MSAEAAMDMRIDVELVLARLTPIERDAVVWHCFEEYSLRETVAFVRAKYPDCPIGSTSGLRHLLDRVRRKLARCR